MTLKKARKKYPNYKIEVKSFSSEFLNWATAELINFKIPIENNSSLFINDICMGVPGCEKNININDVNLSIKALYKFYKKYPYYNDELWQIIK